MREAIGQAHCFIAGQLGKPHAELLGPKDWAPVPNAKLGDFAVPCFKFAKALSKAPPQIAAEIAKNFQKSDEAPLLEECNATGPYLNFKLNRRVAFEHYHNKIQEGTLGHSQVGKDQSLIVEFSSPNIAKEIALHHLRSTAIGNALAKIAAIHGYNVERINYLGDWGTTHGKLLVALDKFGDEEKLKADGVSYMLELYVRFNKEEKQDPELSQQARDAFRKLEEGDSQTRQRWSLFRELSISEFEKVYERLGVDFDHYDGESFYEDRMDDMVSQIDKKIGTRESKGALVCDIPGQENPALLRKDDGASLYLTRDLAAIEDRWNRFKFAGCWYVVATQQKLHFEQLFAIVGLLEKPYAKSLEHIPFGMLSLGDKTMKSREGNVIFLKDVLDEASSKALAIIKEKNPDLENAQEVAAMIGTGAILFSDLSQMRARDVKFSWEAALAFDGDTAPFIQYTHARCCSLVARCQEKLKGLGASDSKEPSKLYEHERVGELLRHWALFESYSDRALEGRDPSQISTAALEIARAFNRLYHEIRFLDQEDAADLALLVDATRSTAKALKESLALLGIQAPDAM